MLDVGLTMSLVTAAMMFAPSLAHAQGVNSHYLGTPAPQLHLAQQYDPPSLPPEIMVPERRPVGRQRAAPPIAAVPLDPLPPEPTPTAPGDPVSRGVGCVSFSIDEVLKRGSNTRIFDCIPRESTIRDRMDP